MSKAQSEKPATAGAASPVVEMLEPVNVPALNALLDEMTANMEPLEDPASLAPPLPDPSDGVQPLPDPASIVEPLREWPAPEVLLKYSS